MSDLLKDNGYEYTILNCVFNYKMVDGRFLVYLSLRSDVD